MTQPRLTPESVGETIAQAPVTPSGERFSVLDLSLDQVASIEDASGIPFGQWGDDDQPRGKLDALLMAAFTGQTVRVTGKMTLREMAAARSAAAGTDPDR